MALLAPGWADLGSAAARCPSLNAKRVTAHTLRHTAAMRLLHPGTDTSVIALWMGHEQAETTQIYLHASTCTPTSPAKNEHSHGPSHPIPGPAATGPPTSSPPSSKPCDYADLSAAHAAATSDITTQVGMIPRSA
jgi:hypothetical protein